MQIHELAIWLPNRRHDGIFGVLQASLAFAGLHIVQIVTLSLAWMPAVKAQMS